MGVDHMMLLVSCGRVRPAYHHHMILNEPMDVDV